MSFPPRSFIINDRKRQMRFCSSWALGGQNYKPRFRTKKQQSVNWGGENIFLFSKSNGNYRISKACGKHFNTKISDKIKQRFNILKRSLSSLLHNLVHRISYILLTRTLLMYTYLIPQFFQCIWQVMSYQVEIQETNTHPHTRKPKSNSTFFILCCLVCLKNKWAAWVTR